MPNENKNPFGAVGGFFAGAAKAAADAAGKAANEAGKAANEAGRAAGKAASEVGKAAGNVGKAVGDAGSLVFEKNAMTFRNSASLQQVANVLYEADAALSDRNRTIDTSQIADVLRGALLDKADLAAGVAGAGAGGAIGFLALYGLGTTGFSAAGITSGLAAAGGLAGGGMAAGVGVLAAPVAILGIGGYAVASNLKGKKLEEEKQRLYKEALAKHQAIIEELHEENEANKERLDYLNSLNILLERAVSDLAKDLGEE